jgi:hypothetical protein
MQSIGMATRARVNEIAERVLDGYHHIGLRLASLCYRFRAAVSCEDNRSKRSVRHLRHPAILPGSVRSMPLGRPPRERRSTFKRSRDIASPHWRP